MKIVVFILDALLARAGGYLAGSIVFNYFLRFFKAESIWNIFESGPYVEVSSNVHTVTVLFGGAILAAIIGESLRWLVRLIPRLILPYRSNIENG